MFAWSAKGSGCHPLEVFSFCLGLSILPAEIGACASLRNGDAPIAATLSCLGDPSVASMCALTESKTLRLQNELVRADS